MSRPIRSIVSIRHRGSDPGSGHIAAVAYELWLDRCFRNGSPEEDLLTAFQEAVGAGPPKPFLVPGRGTSAAIDQMGVPGSATDEVKELVSQLLKDRIAIEQQICVLEQSQPGRFLRTRSKSASITEIRRVNPTDSHS